MKTFKLILSIGILAFVFTACQQQTETKTTLVDFENVTLKDSVWNGSDKSGTAVKVVNPYYAMFGGDSILTNYNGSFISQIASFNNVYTAEWYSWSGFACSAKIDSTKAGYLNQYSVMAGSGALNSKQFGLAYDSASLVCQANSDGKFSIKSIMLTNSTYAYLYMKTSFVKDSWFKVIITGFLNKVQTSKVEYYLADYRNGKTFISKTWNKVDLSALGEVDQVSFTFDSSDSYSPSYTCIDNIEFTQTISTK
jgi:hypothetical protein